MLHGTFLKRQAEVSRCFLTPHAVCGLQIAAAQLFPAVTRRRQGVRPCVGRACANGREFVAPYPGQGERDGELSLGVKLLMMGRARLRIPVRVLGSRLRIRRGLSLASRLGVGLAMLTNLSLSPGWCHMSVRYEPSSTFRPESRASAD